MGLGPLGWIDAALGLFGAFDQSRMSQEALNFWKERYGRADTELGNQQAADLAAYQGIADQFSPRYGQIANDVQAGTAGILNNQSAALNSLYGNLNQGLDSVYGTMNESLVGNYDTMVQGYQDVQGGYADRSAQAMGMLNGYGEQQRADLAQTFANSGAAGQAALTNAGLAGTSLSANAATGNAMQQEAAGRRLGEDLTRMKLGTYLSTTGEGLSARQQGIQSLGQQGYLNATALGTMGQQNAQALASQAYNNANQQTQTGIWGLGTNTAAQQYALAGEQQMAALPIQQNYQEMANKWGMLFGAGNQPEMVSPFLMASTALTPLVQSKMQSDALKDQSQGSPFSMGLML